MQPPGSDSPVTSLRWQFSVASLFSWMLAAALVLSYLRQIDGLNERGFLAISATLLIGTTLGWLTGSRWQRSREAAFWSIVIGGSVVVSVIGERSEGALFAFVWTGVGLWIGAICGASPNHHRLLRIGLGTLAATLLMTVLAALTYPHFSSTPTFDILVAAPIGGLIGVLISIAEWMAVRYRIPFHMIACWLLGAVIVGNLLVSRFRP